MSDGERVVLPPMTIHERMAGILGELPAIGKDQRNDLQKFMYRSHDDVLNALNPLLAKWGVFVVPQVLDRVTAERKTSKGGVLYEVNLHVQYTFYGLSGDRIVASVWGEGTDSSDKSTNKAMTMAFKNVLAQAFAVSTGDTIDSDSQSSEETTGRTDPKLRDLEALIEEVKAADQDPAHGGGYYYQVAVNAAAKYHHKKLDELAPGEIADLENRFRGLLKELTPSDEVEKQEEAPAGSEPELGSGLRDPLPITETEVRKGPESVAIPASWAEIEAAIRAYDDGTWAAFWVFSDQAREALFPGGQRMSQQRKDTLFQKAAGVTIALREAHDPGALPPPIRIELQAHWSKVLGGAVLEGPEWAMDASEAAAGRPPRPEPVEASAPSTGAHSEGDGVPQPETAHATSPVGAPSAPSEETFTDAPLTDDEQRVLDAIDEEFPGAVRVDGE